MRNLLITIGSPASGKSTWIEKNGLLPYTLCPDTLRLMLSSPQYDTDGNIYISQAKDKQTWELMMRLLEERMKDGHFTVIDATHTRKKYLGIYNKLCDKYRYRLYGKLFNPSLEELLKRNSEREIYKKVPDEVIKMHFERLREVYIQKGIQLIENINELNEFVRYPDYSNYPNAWFIGDIHGCSIPLNEFVRKYYNKEDLYVFMGDYIDRGYANAEVLKTLMQLHENKNVILLEGNHENWLWLWATDRENEIRSKEFINNTLPDFQKNNFDKKSGRIFYRMLQTFFTCKHRDRTLIATHAGVPTHSFDFISTSQLTRGIGKYEDDLKVAESFMKNSANVLPISNMYMIMGHRNISNRGIDFIGDCGRVCNLEGKIENGGELRWIKFGDVCDNGSIKSDYIWQGAEVKPLSEKDLEVEPLLEQLEKSTNVRKKDFDNIRSYNFTRKVFYDREWNKLTIRARGLFVNKNTKKIVARSYNKFFNINERKETELESIAINASYPVKCFLKENGFLGIVGYDSETDKILYCSKSSMVGDYADMVKNALQDKEEAIRKIVTSGASLIFEIIEPIKDPHIIKYNKSEVILLDIILNDWEYNKMSYDSLKKYSEYLNIPHKTLLFEAKNWAELKDFLDSFDTIYKDREGAVLEDSNGFMVKYKGEYYNRWKRLRTLKDRVCKSDFMITNSVFDSESIKFLKWCKIQGEDYLKNTDIITLRDKYLQDGINY